MAKESISGSSISQKSSFFFFLFLFFFFFFFFLHMLHSYMETYGPGVRMGHKITVYACTDKLNQWDQIMFCTII